VDILLNNAGHNVRKPLVEYTLEEFGYTQEGLRRDFATYCERFLAGRI